MSYQKNGSATRRYARLMKFGAWIQNIPNKVTPPPFRLMQIGSLFWQSRVLHAIAVLDVASVLSDDSLSSEAIAQKVSAEPESLFRVLRMAVSMGIFEEDQNGNFKNNKLSEYLRDDNPQNVRAMVLMHNSEPMSRPWYENLVAGIKSGVMPFKLSHGDDLYSYMDKNAEFDELFSKAMDSVEALTGDSFATDFDWGKFNRLIDIGGSKGSKALTILKHHPKLQAIVFDREQVIEQAQEYWSNRQQSNLSKIKFQAGDARIAVPAATDRSDIYLLSGVLHGFDDEHCVQILQNIGDSIGNTGAQIAIMEIVMDEESTDLSLASFDLQMLMATEGKERTLNEWLKVFRASGFQLTEVINLRSFPKILLIQLSG